MKTEIEAKFLDIDPAAVRNQLRSIGARQVYPEHLMKRKTFDYPDRRLNNVGGWVRVRQEADAITLAYKQLDNRTIHGTKEVSVKVDDFDRTCEFLTDIGLIEKSYQETRRELWLLGSAEITIDTWPWIPTFMEIEAETESSVRDITRRLGLSWEQTLFGSVEIVYQKYFNVTDTEIDSWPKIIFEPIPAEIERKRKK